MRAINKRGPVPKALPGNYTLLDNVQQEGSILFADFLFSFPFFFLLTADRWWWGGLRAFSHPPRHNTRRRRLSPSRFSCSVSSLSLAPH